MNRYFTFSLLLCLLACTSGTSQPHIYKAGTTLESRIHPPAGYVRTSVPVGSFGAYLRVLPLRPHGSPVLLHTGEHKHTQQMHAAVVKLDVGTRDLQQCADAVIRLRAEYLWQQRRYADISFNFTSGFRCDWLTYAAGSRVRVTGSNVTWVPRAAKADSSYAAFRQYLDLVFTYAGTRSLQRELKPVSATEPVAAGQVFIQGGTPGHAVLVLEVAVHNVTGKRIMLLGQSYMPAQDFHVLINPNDAALSPWYAADSIQTLTTPEWEFMGSERMAF